MNAATYAAAERAGQLRLAVRTRGARRAEPRPYWDHADLADVGGELRAGRPGVKVILAAEQLPNGGWTGYYDLVLPSDGCDGTTPPLETRADALTSAAYQLVRYCEHILAANGSAPRDNARAARQLIAWLRDLALL